MNEPDNAPEQKPAARNKALTTVAAVRLGRNLRFLRNCSGLTLREVGQRGGISYQYVANAMHGDRQNMADKKWPQLAAGLGVPWPWLASLVLEARVLTALERHGLNAEQQTFVWVGVEQRINEQGVEVNTDVARMCAELLKLGVWPVIPEPPKTEEQP